MIDASMYKLGDICDVSSGGTPRRSERAFWDGGTIPWVKISDITGKYVEATEEFITDEGLAHSPAKLIQPGAVLYSIFASIGATGILTIPAATNQAIAAVRPKDRRLSTDYLYHWLRAQENAARASSRGVAQNNINLSILRAMEMPLPDYDVQEGIVAGFDAILLRRDSYSDQLVKLDELVKSRFVEMFGDPETNPMGWETRTIGELATDVRYGTSKPASPDGEYTYIRMNNMTYEGGLDLSDTKRITLEGRELDNAVVRYGDLLFNRTNSRDKVGKTCVFKFDEPMVIAGYIIRVRLRDCIEAEYLSTYLNTSHSKRMLREMAHGAVNQANINAKEMQSIAVPIPPLELQGDFLAFVQQVDKLKFETQQAIDKLQMLYDSLAQEYFGS